MPGTTQFRQSSDDDEGVGVAWRGGDREGRVNADPQGSEVCAGAAIASTRARHRQWMVPGTEPFAPLAAFRRRRGLGARTVPRGSVTRQTLSSPLVSAVSKGTEHAGAPGSGRRSESKTRRGARRCLGPEQNQETVHAAWWSGPRPRVFDLRSRERSRADAGGHKLRRGRPR